MVGDIVHGAHSIRKWVGPARYLLMGLKMFLCSCRLREYKADIKFTCSEDGDIENSLNTGTEAQTVNSSEKE